MVSLDELIKKVYNDYKKIGKGCDESYETYMCRRDIWDDLTGISSSSIREVVIPFLGNWGRQKSGSIDLDKLTKVLWETEPLIKPLKKLAFASVEIFQPLEPTGKNLSSH